MLWFSYNILWQTAPKSQEYNQCVDSKAVMKRSETLMTLTQVIMANMSNIISRFSVTGPIWERGQIAGFDGARSDVDASSWGAWKWVIGGSSVSLYTLGLSCSASEDHKLSYFRTFNSRSRMMSRSADLQRFSRGSSASSGRVTSLGILCGVLLIMPMIYGYFRIQLEYGRYAARASYPKYWNNQQWTGVQITNVTSVISSTLHAIKGE
jgi:hypothetical protein